MARSILPRWRNTTSPASPNAIKTNVNQRLGTDLVHDILLVEINYVDKASLKQAGG